MVQNDLALLSRLEFAHSLPVVNDGEHFAAIRPSLPVSLKFDFGSC